MHAAGQSSNAVDAPLQACTATRARPGHFHRLPMDEHRLPLDARARTPTAGGAIHGPRQPHSSCGGIGNDAMDGDVLQQQRQAPQSPAGLRR